MAKADSGSAQNRTQFPIESTPEGFARRRRTFLIGVSHEHADAIEALQPYRGCDWTSDLATLSNPDKHRELHGTFGIQEGRERVEVRPAAQVAGQSGVWRAIVGDPAGRYAKTNTDVAMFSVTFADRGPLGVVEILEILVSEVSGTLDTFRSEF